MRQYVREAATADVARLARNARLATSRLTFVEVASAVARRLRGGDLSPASARRIARAVEHDRGRFDVVEFGEAVERSARALLASHELRAGDAVQLASALCLREDLGRDVEFVCFDDLLCAAARAEGLRVRP